MGRRGYVITQPAKYGDSCVSDWAQTSFYNFLMDKTKLDVNTDNEWAPQDADHWTISIPDKVVKCGKGKRIVADYDHILKVAKRLKARPGLVKDRDGESYGDQCAWMLEEGIKAARKHKLFYIAIDWA